MARLEIHGSHGELQKIELPASGSLLIGSDAVCDLHLADREIQPIHARLKVQGGVCQVEATPEGQFVRLNGKKSAKAALGPGDELGLGGYRIYMFESAAAAPVPTAPRQARPPVAAAPPAPEPRPKAPIEAKRPEPVEEPMELGWDDVASDPSEVRPSPSMQSAFMDDRPKPKRDRKTSLTEAASGEPLVSGTRRGVTVFADDETEQRKLSKTPLVLILAGTLAALSVTAFGLWWIIERTTANRAYDAAVANYEAGDFATSGQRFRDFLRMRPSDDRSSNARVLEALSRLRELSGGAAPQLAAAVALADKELPALQQEPSWADRGMEAAEIVATLVRDLAVRAKQTASSETVEQARVAYKLHESLAGEAAAKQRERLKVDLAMAEAEASVAKGEAKNKALADIDSALKARQAATAFGVRDALLNRYPEMAADPAVSRRLEQANLQVVENVKPLGLTREAQTTEAPSALGPPLTVFVRSRGNSSSNAANANVAPKDVLVISGGGLLVGLDNRDGSVVWQRPTGNEPGFDPIAIPDDSPPSVLAFDDRDRSLVRLALADGRLIWRQPLGDTPRSVPLLLGNRLILALPTLGHLLWLDLATGKINDGLDMKWPLAGSVVASSNNQTLYLPADQSVLFAVQVEPRKALSSVYLGHQSGSLRVPPARSGRFLFFAENHEMRTGSLRTLLLDDRSQAPQRLQQEPLEGWSWFAPGQRGTLLWASHDRGGFSVFGIGDQTQSKPLTQVGRSPAVNAPARATAAIAVGQREALIVDRTAKHYRLDAQSGRMDILRSWNLPDGVPASAVTPLDDYRYVIRLAGNRDLGRIAVAIDLREENPLWTTAWGVPMDLESASPKDGKVKWVDARGDSVEVDLKATPRAGAVDWFPKPASPAEAGTEDPDKPEVDWNWTTIGPDRVALSAAMPNRIRFRKGADGKEVELTLPIPTKVPPLRLGDSIVVAGEGGEVALASLADGSPRGQPFVPDFEKTTPWVWTSLAALDENSVALADKTGRVVRLVLESDPPRLRQTARVSLESAFSGVLISTGRAALALMTDGSVISLAGRDLSTQAKWTFPGGGTRLFGLDGSSAMIFHPSGKIRVVDASGQSEREADLADAMPAGQPVRFRDDLIWLTHADASELVVWSAKAPAPVKSPLGQWVLGPIVPSDADWFVAERPGMLRRIPAELRAKAAGVADSASKPDAPATETKP